MHFKNFDPNTNIYEAYAYDVDKIELPGLLMELSKNYFKQLGHIEIKKEEVKNPADQSIKMVYQCTSCFTVYDETYGDAKAGIEKETLFDAVPDTYTCSVCEAPKSNFEKKELQLS